ncbi:hypothetical protein IWX47DRAFT_845416 [Phyllosticta citricarpa]
MSNGDAGDFPAMMRDHVHRFVDVENDLYDPEKGDCQERRSRSRHHSHQVFRFLDLPKEVRLLIYEFTFARRIVNLGYYHSVYRWNFGRRFFFSAPGMGIEPQNHLNLLSDFQQPVAQAPGFPPHPDSPELDLSLVTTSWIRFLTIVLRAEVDGFGTRSHWYDIRTRPLPNLASMHFITRVFYDSSCSYVFNGEGPVWWNDGYQAPLSPETVHAIPDLFRLLIHSTPFTKFEISVDDIEIKTEADTYAREGKPMLYIGSTKSGDKHRSIQEELEFFSLTEERKKIYIEGFRRRLAEEPKEQKIKEEQDGKRDDENEGDSEGRAD